MPASGQGIQPAPAEHHGGPGVESAPSFFGEAGGEEYGPLMAWNKDAHGEKHAMLAALIAGRVGTKEEDRNVVAQASQLNPSRR